MWGVAAVGSCTKIKTEPRIAKISPPDILIHRAAEDGNIEAVKQQLAAGVDVNVKGSYKRTPLHDAAQFGHKEIAELLIAKGADVNAKTGRGTTPLDLAIALKHTEIADLLRKYGSKSWCRIFYSHCCSIWKY